MYVCRNEANAGLFQAETTTCNAQAAIDERRAQNESQQGYKPEHGEMVYSTPIDDDLVAGSGLVFNGHRNAS